jgi:endonuclease/exonuclease/phosphatase (EEP) superfamily protein YafD
MTTRLLWFLYILSWAGVGGACIALLGAAAWPDDLANDTGWFVLVSWLAFMATVFKFHIGLGSAVCGVLGLLTARAIKRRARVFAGAVVVACLLGLAPGVASWLPRRDAGGPAKGSIVVMSANLMYGLADAEPLMRQVEAHAPDVIVFQEYTPGAAAKWGPLLAGAYPHRVEHARDDAFGQAVYSKQEFLAPPRIYPAVGEWTEPQICVLVDVGGRATPVVNVHVWPPASAELVREHRKQVAWIAEWGAALAREHGGCVMAGDFNATPGTAHLRAVEGAGFHEAHEVAGWGRGTTWPRQSLLSVAPGIRLDHVFASGEVASVEAWCGEDTGSDHRPIFARLAR